MTKQGFLFSSLPTMQESKAANNLKKLICSDFEKNMGVYGLCQIDDLGMWKDWSEKHRNARLLFCPHEGGDLQWAKTAVAMKKHFEDHEMTVVQIQELADMMTGAYDMICSAVTANTRTADRRTKMHAGGLQTWNPKALSKMAPQVDTNTMDYQIQRIRRVVSNHAECLKQKGSHFGGFPPEDVPTRHS